MNSNSELVKSLYSNNIVGKYAKLKDTTYLSNNIDCPIFEYFSDFEKMESEDTVGVYFTTNNRVAGCAIFEALTSKEASDCINDDEENEGMIFTGFTIGIEFEKPLDPDNYSIYCATIAFTMEDEDGLYYNVDHQDIDNCLNVIVKKAISILQS